MVWMIASVCVGKPIVLTVRRHGPVHESRGARSAPDTFNGIRMLVACYEYSDMINSFQPLWRAENTEGAAGSQLDTALDLWRSPSEVGVSCLNY